MTPAPALSPSELRRNRDALFQRLASTADEIEPLGATMLEQSRESWIARAVRYLSERQVAVDRLAEIDAALGGEGPDPSCHRALQRIIEADRLLLAHAGRLVAEIQAESAERTLAVRAVRR